MTVKKLFDLERMRQELQDILASEPVTFIELGERIGVNGVTIRRFILNGSKPHYVTSFLISKYIREYNQPEPLR
jgi:predicted transcriptional regulator